MREKLERDIYNREEIVDGSYIEKAPDRWQQTASYRAENERDQELVDEINFVLEYFRPQPSSWPVWAYAALGAIVAIVLVLATLAILR